MLPAPNPTSRRALPISTASPSLVAGRPTTWINPSRQDTLSALGQLNIDMADIEMAAARWHRFAPLLARLFPDTAAAGGTIDSDLIELCAPINSKLLVDRGGRILVKADHALPVTGCIKARGGIYEVLVHAESLALKSGLISRDGDYGVLADEPARRFFEQQRIVVGSTGNLGFSVGVIGRALGFQVEVHMSADAKAWKKARLRKLGSEVIEHGSDYGAAVASARHSANARSNCYFVDDENSLDLFLGYAAAALDLKRQLATADIDVDAEHPLVVFLPCGVGGAPGGVTFGLKHLFGEAVRCVFVEPTAAPCMLVQLSAGTEKSVSVYDIGLTNRTAADGLAVAAASMLVARTVEHLVDAIVTVEDNDLFRFAEQLHHLMGFRLEPSAAAGFAAMEPYFAALGSVGNPTIVVWTTGGNLLPNAEFEAILNWGRAISARSADG